MSSALAIGPGALARSDAQPQRRTIAESLTSVADAGSALAVEGAARVAGAVDWAASLPRRGGDAVSSLHIPVVSAVAPTVGAIFSGVFGVLAHGQSFGALKWLQTLRLWHGVERGIADSFKGAENVAPLTVKSFLACVSDKDLRDNLTGYFSALTRVRDLEEAHSAAPALQDAKGELAKFEFRIGQRAELLELQSLVTVADSAQLASHAQLERIAENMASKMIAAVESVYKNRLGWLGSEMQGTWTALASKGEGGREQLRTALRDRLLTVYEAEQRGELGNLADAKAAVHEAFLTKSMMREATFYSVLGVLMNTGAISTVVDAVREHGGVVYDMLKTVGDYLVPDWIQRGLSAGLEYAKAALYTVWSYMGLKAGLGAVDLYKHMTPHQQHSDPGALRVDAGSAHVDAGTAHADTGVSHGTDVMRVDAARAEAAQALSGQPLRVDHADAFSAAHGDAGSAHSVAPRVDFGSAHADPRVDSGATRVDPGTIKPKVQIK